MSCLCSCFCPSNNRLAPAPPNHRLPNRREFSLRAARHYSYQGNLDNAYYYYNITIAQYEPLLNHIDATRSSFEKRCIRNLFFEYASFLMDHVQPVRYSEANIREATYYYHVAAALGHYLAQTIINQPHPVVKDMARYDAPINPILPLTKNEPSEDSVSMEVCIDDSDDSEDHPESPILENTETHIFSFFNQQENDSDTMTITITPPEIHSFTDPNITHTVPMDDSNPLFLEPILKSLSKG